MKYFWFTCIKASAAMNATDEDYYGGRTSAEKSSGYFPTFMTTLLVLLVSMTFMYGVKLAVNAADRKVKEFALYVDNKVTEFTQKLGSFRPIPATTREVRFDRPITEAELIRPAITNKVPAAKEMAVNTAETNNTTEELQQQLAETQSLLEEARTKLTIAQVSKRALCADLDDMDQRRDISDGKLVKAKEQLAKAEEKIAQDAIGHANLLRILKEQQAEMLERDRVHSLVQHPEHRNVIDRRRSQ